MPYPTQQHTSWPLIWSRTLRAHNAIARQNALIATRVVHERRLEREARYFGD